MYKQGLQIIYQNIEDVTCTVNIYDTFSGVGDTTFTQLTGAGDVQHIFTTDNDETKFTPVKAKQMEAKFVSTAAVNLNTFIGSADNRWYVESFTGNNLQFRGFLVLDDMDEDFLDSDTKNEVTLIATDNIGLLKDIPLTKSDNTNPRGYYSIIQYLAWCLEKTGITANINVVHNVREEHNPDQIMYQSCVLWSTTFEKEIDESISCYEALELILGQDAYLTQENGEWWIIRIDELQDNSAPCTVFDSAGNFVQTTTFNPIQAIGPAQAIMFSQMATFVKVQAAVKSVALTYNYQFPKEIVDNIDFSRGGFFSIIDPYNPLETYSAVSAFPLQGDKTRFYKATDTGKYYIYKDAKYLEITATAFHLADWQTVGGPSAYIRRIYKDNYEIERYVVLPQSAGSQDHYIQSNPVPLHQNDKFYFNIDWRLTEDLVSSGSATVFMAQVRLIGDDGSYWMLTNQNSGSEVSGNWIRSNSTWAILRYIANTYVINQRNETDFLSASVQSDPLPVSGKIVILIREFSANGKRETHVANLQFNYLPYINGSYQKYTAQRYTISQAVNTKKKVEEDVQMADSPKRLFKGALLYWNGTDHVLCGRFYDGRQFGGSVPADDYLHPFTHNQAYCVWNQWRRPFRLFDFTVQGLNGAALAGITHKYVIDEASVHTTGKWFMLLHMDQDLNLCEWKGVLAEYYDTAQPKDYNSPIELKYITE